MIDRAGLADFLRLRRQAVQPEDVGMPRGPRRRTEGLRREEVAVLCHMSTDDYARLERQRGPQPSAEMVASMAQGLHLSLDERDHLFRLAGREPPTRGATSEHISPGLLRVLDRLHDTPAEIVTELGETSRQSPLGTALLGDASRWTGPARSVGYRWFTDPETRRLHDPAEHAHLFRFYAASLRRVVTLRGPGSRAARLADLLLRDDEEFRLLWAQHEVGLAPDDVKTFVHPQVGTLRLSCQRLLDLQQSHVLLVYTAQPGTADHDKLQMLGVIGTQLMATRSPR